MVRKKKCEAGDEGEEKENDEAKVRTIKTQLKNILRPNYRTAMISAITEKSIIATEICHLASLLFLYRVEKAFDDRHYAFFQQNGDKIIRQCFLDVCQKNNNNIDDEFHEYATENQIMWPNHAYFGNALNDLIDTYTTNVKNNLKVHQAKRLRQYLLMTVYQNNLNPIVVQYAEEDINRLISLSIYGNDSIRTIDIETVAARERRDVLLDKVLSECWYDIPDKNIGRFTKTKWFESIQFWLSLQRKIDEFNTTEDQREDRKVERAQYRERQKCKRRNHQDCTCKKPETQIESKSDTAQKGPPRIKNLSVIPICSFTRTHITLDNATLYNILCGENIIKMEKGKGGRLKRAISRNEFFKDKDWYWNEVFDMRKISQLVHGKKKFRYRILSNGHSVSLQFDADKKDCLQFDKETIVRELKQNKFEIEAATDPGEHTWSATVVRDIKTGKEYHWLTQEKVRKRKAKRWTAEFTRQEQNDRNNHALYEVMPSPMGHRWIDYIRHRLKMHAHGIDVYTTDKYTRLSFDKYVRSNSVCDSIAQMFTGNRPALIHFGAAERAPNSPIGIKKNLRCPGTRKMMRSYRKCRNCRCNMVDEYFTSQTCAKCYARFDRRTKRNRFKVCTDCRPDPTAMLPSLIVTKIGRKRWREMRLIEFLLEQDAEENNGNQSVGDAAHPNEPTTDRLHPKVMLHHKTWLVNPVTGILEYVKAEQTDEMEVVDWTTHEPRAHKTIWHRDIVAAKCIMIKGHCDLLGLPIPINLQRPSQHNN